MNIEKQNLSRDPQNWVEVETIFISKCCHSTEYFESDLCDKGFVICGCCGEETELIEVPEDYFRN